MSLANSAVPDHIKRAADEYNLHVAMGNVGKWLAFQLSDGSCDHTPYDSRRDAIRHQLHERTAMYLEIVPDGISYEDISRLFSINRKVYDAGFRFCDPDGPELIMPNTVERMNEAMRNIDVLRVGYRHGVN